MRRVNCWSVSYSNTQHWLLSVFLGRQHRTERNRSEPFGTDRFGSRHTTVHTNTKTAKPQTRAAFITHTTSPCTEATFCKDPPLRPAKSPTRQIIRRNQQTSQQISKFDSPISLIGRDLDLRCSELPTRPTTTRTQIFIFLNLTMM